MLFSVITVTLNAGAELKKTVHSVLTQDFKDLEIIIKDGGSTDGSILELPVSDKIKLVRKKDRSIYDGMNEAVKEAQGEYIIFLNAGDRFASGEVLEKTAQFMSEHRADIYYGNLYRREQDSTDVYPDKLTDRVCYGNVPCHQACFYKAELLKKETPFDLSYKVRADYEHFLRCVYRDGARTIHMPFTVSDYEGGGFSEDEINRKRSAYEHRLITKKYLGNKVYRYRLLMILTLQPLRELLAGSRTFSGLYHKLKAFIYRISGR